MPLVGSGPNQSAFRQRHNGMALFANQQGDWRTARRQYEKALELDPESVTAQNNLANLLADHGQPDEATTHYEWLLQHSQQDPAAVMVNYAADARSRGIRKTRSRNAGPRQKK